ncbi:MAG: outer membrane lipoprotein-sorting protein [Gammaproteobacteria bacterium]|nr:outer membrane lipoprotein-sorting protein [Gammaproteobacteria bacterium]MDH5729664.1 outer membrane lipoprotein-sorting protein [Gammaproteobacteria bacterium]
MHWKLLAIILLLAFNGLLQAADDANARAIMQKVDARDDGDNQTSNMQMILIDKKGRQRIRDISSFRKDKGKDTQSIIFFRSPADVKNTGFLTYDYDDESKDDDQWLYLPALKKSKRIAASDKSGSFMGSDFNYSDMTSRNLNDFDFQLKKEMEVDGHAVWVIESTPRSKDVIEETGYKKSMAFVRKDNYFVIRAINWEEKGGKMKYFEVKDLKQIDGIWTPLEMQMTSKQGKQTLHKTILKFSNIKFNQTLDDNMFSLRQLEKGL